MAGGGYELACSRGKAMMYFLSGALVVQCQSNRREMKIEQRTKYFCQDYSALWLKSSLAEGNLYSLSNL